MLTGRRGARARTEDLDAAIEAPVVTDRQLPNLVCADVGNDLEASADGNPRRLGSGRGAVVRPPSRPTRRSSPRSCWSTPWRDAVYGPIDPAPAEPPTSVYSGPDQRRPGGGGLTAPGADGARRRGLRGERLLVAPSGWWSRTQLEAAALSAGFHVQVAFESGTAASLVALAEAGAGIVVIADDAGAPVSLTWPRLTLRRRVLSSPVEIFWHPHRPLSRACRVVLDAIG